MSIVFKYLVDTKVRYFLEIVEKKQTSSVGPLHLGRTVVSWEWLLQVGLEPYTTTPKYYQWITIH